MTLNVKDGGVWRDIENVFVKDGGVWRDIQNVFVKDGGVWREVFTAFSASFTGTFPSIFDTALVDVITSTTSITCNISSGTLNATATISGSGSNPLIQKNGIGPYLSSQTVSDGDTLKARHTSSASSSTSTTTTVSLAGYDSETFTSTTESPP